MMSWAKIIDRQQAQGARDAFIRLDEISQPVWRVVEKVMIVDRILIIQEDCQGVDAGFHHILEEMRAERRLWRCADLPAR